MTLVAVTGGAGYIGSNVCEYLQQRGFRIRIIDDFSTGRRARLSHKTVELYEGSITDRQFIFTALRDVNAVIHLAAKKSVEESVVNPLSYYENNVLGTINLISAMLAHNIKKIVFSSTAVVYATSGRAIREEDPKEALSPYAHSKLLIEEFLQKLFISERLASISLRYFNVVGSSGEFLGDTARDNLVPKVFAELNSGKIPQIYGHDYGTKDGTCVRDYVHVQDLSEAHALALEFLLVREEAEVFNVGSGKGYSVREVLEEISRVTNMNFLPVISPKRTGDPEMLVADISKIEKHLGWRPKSTLEMMIKSAWLSDKAMVPR